VIEDRASANVKPAERDESEVDGPDIVGDLLESDVLATEQIRDEDAQAGPADASVGGDLPDLEVSRVLGVLQLCWERTGRRSIDGSRWPLSVRLVGSDLVEVGPESVEPALLSGPSRSGWNGGFGLEIPMHAFVATVLLR